MWTSISRRHGITKRGCYFFVRVPRETYHSMPFLGIFRSFRLQRMDKLPGKAPQSRTHASVSSTSVQIIRLCLSPRTTSRTISFSNSNIFGINLIPFFDICSVRAVLSPRMFGHVLLYLGRCAVATVAVCGFWQLVFSISLRAATSNLPSFPVPSQTELCNSCCLWFWQLVFSVSLRAATSNLPSFPVPSQTELCSTIGESIRP